MALDFDTTLRVSKHFQNTWMRRWDWGIPEIREALKQAEKIEPVGKSKYEAYTRYKCKGKSRKLILADYGDEILIITGAEGK